MFRITDRFRECAPSLFANNLKLIATPFRLIDIFLLSAISIVLSIIPTSSRSSHSSMITRCRRTTCSSTWRYAAILSSCTNRRDTNPCAIPPALRRRGPSRPHRQTGHRQRLSSRSQDLGDRRSASIRFALHAQPIGKRPGFVQHLTPRCQTRKQ
jgi:hypothetical protein